jgi:hypothetical protein
MNDTKDCFFGNNGSHYEEKHSKVTILRLLFNHVAKIKEES